MIPRRQVCQWLGCAMVVGCAPEGPVDGIADWPAADDPGWVEVTLPPALENIGGQAVVSVPEALLEVVVVRRDEETVIAVWRICSHGACALSWEDEETVFRCPCHGSEFDEDGAVLREPASEGVRAFPAELEGETLRIYRPL